MATVRAFPVLPPRSSVTDEEMAEAVELVFREAPGWTQDLNALGSLAGLSTNATSTTEITNTPGQKTIEIEAGKGFMVPHKIWVAFDKTDYMEADVDDYDIVTGDLTFTPTRNLGGAGAHSSWRISLRPDPANVGKQAYAFMAAAWKPRATNGATIVEFETPTHKSNFRVLSFDKSTPQYAQLQLPLDLSWDAGTISFRAICSHSTNEAVNNKFRLQLAAFAIGDGDSLDTAYGTPQYVNDVGGAGGTQYTSAESDAITVGGAPAKGTRLCLELGRDADDAVNDTLDQALYVHGVVVYITHDQGNDA